GRLPARRRTGRVARTAGDRGAAAPSAGAAGGAGRTPRRGRTGRRAPGVRSRRVGRRLPSGSSEVVFARGAALSPGGRGIVSRTCAGAFACCTSAPFRAIISMTRQGLFRMLGGLFCSFNRRGRPQVLPDG